MYSPTKHFSNTALNIFFLQNKGTLIWACPKNASILIVKALNAYSICHPNMALFWNDIIPNSLAFNLR